MTPILTTTAGALLILAAAFLTHWLLGLAVGGLFLLLIGLLVEMEDES